MFRTGRVSFRMRVFGALTLAAFVSGCAGNSVGLSPQPHPALTPVGSLAAGTKQRVGHVVLPSGSTIDLTTLSISNSLGTSPVARDGSFALPAFVDGPQLTTVSDAAGNPVLLGFLSDAEPNANARTTAGALLYYQLGIFSLPDALQLQFVGQIGSSPNEAGVESAISAALRTAPTDPLRRNNATISAALVAAFPAPFTQPPAVAHAVARNVRPATNRRDGITLSPSTVVSGLTLIQDYPSSVHFQNEYRRVAEVYVDETAPNAKSLSTNPLFLIPSIQGLGSTVSNVVDIASGNFGFSQIDTPQIELPQDGNAPITRYTLRAVGPGAAVGLDTLTATQRARQARVNAAFFAQNLLIPLVLSIVAPIGVSRAGIDSAPLDAFRDFVDLYFQKVPDAGTQLSAAQYHDALVTFVKAILTSNSLQSATLNAIANIVGKAGAASFTATNASQGLAKVFLVLDTFFTSADIGALGYSLGHSNAVETFEVAVTPAKVTLDPPTKTLDNGGAFTLTASVPDYDRTNNSAIVLSYAWSVAPQDGTSPLSGTLFGPNGKTNNFTSDVRTASYIANNSGNGTDVVSVVVTVFDMTKNTKTVLNAVPVTSVITVGKGSPTLTSPVIAAIGDVVPIVATAPKLAGATGYEYHWTNTALGGTLTGSGGVDTFVDTVAPTTTGSTDTTSYLAKTGGKTDTIGLEVFAVTPTGKTSLGKVSTTVLVRTPRPIFGPATSTIANDKTVTLAVTFPSGVDPNATYQYSWKNTAMVGHITDGTVGNLDTFSGSIPSVTYTANHTGLGSDTVSVGIVETLGNKTIDLGTQTALVTIAPAPTPTPMPPVTYPTVSLSPPCVNFGYASTTVTFTGTIQGGTPLPLGQQYAYRWYKTQLGNFSLDHPFDGFSLNVPNPIFNDGGVLVTDSPSVTVTNIAIDPKSTDNGPNNQIHLVIYIKSGSNLGTTSLIKPAISPITSGNGHLGAPNCLNL